MRHMILVLALLLVTCGTVSAINPGYSDEPKFAPGGATTIITFGPYASGNLAPSSYVMWSSDGGEFWFRRFFWGGGYGHDFEPTGIPVPSSYVEAALDVCDTMSGYYTFIEINATSVAAADSVPIVPYFGR